MTARFVRGSATLDLQSGRYSLMPDFRPPSIDRALNLAGGSAANAYGGADLVSAKAQNREWAFTVRILGTTASDVEAGARAISRFLLQAGDASTPTYFEYKEDSNPIPLWGQFGAPLRYEVVAGRVELGEQYGSYKARSTWNAALVTLVVKPVAVGFAQRLASGKGGLIEDTLGAVDGVSRGLVIPQGTTNKMTNPIFGHATWNNTWSVSNAALAASQNTDSQFIGWGNSSALLFNSSASQQTFYQAITAGNTNQHTISAYVKRPDGAAVTSADCVLFYSVTQTTTYTLVGNGVYRLTVTLAGINASTNIGLTLNAGRMVYLLGFQFEEWPYAGQFCYGEMLACSWSGTAHASTSTRPGGSVRLAYAADTLTMMQGTFSLVWQPDQPNTRVPDGYIFSCGATSLRAYFNATDDKFYLTDNANTISSAAQTFAAGDRLALDFTWGPGGLNIYKNGANIATGATYAPPAAPSYLYIGVTDTTTNNLMGTLMGLEIYGTELTSGQVAALYAAKSPLIARGEKVSTVPWLWTKDGDDIVDNYIDGTHQNYAVSGGVPGSLDAITRIQMTPSHLHSTISGEDVYLSKTTNPYFVDPQKYLYAGALTISVDGTHFPGDADSTGLVINNFDPLKDRDGFFFAPIIEGGGSGDITAYWTYQYGSSGAINSPVKNLAGKIDGINPKLFILPPLSIPQRILRSTTATQSITRSLTLHRAAALAFNVTLSFRLTMPRPLIRLYNKSQADLTNPVFVYEGSKLTIESAGSLYCLGIATGDYIELTPGVINTFITVLGSNTLGSPTGGYYSSIETITYNIVQVTPRYALL